MVSFQGSAVDMHRMRAPRCAVTTSHRGTYPLLGYTELIADLLLSGGFWRAQSFRV